MIKNGIGGGNTIIGLNFETNLLILTKNKLKFEKVCQKLKLK